MVAAKRLHVYSGVSYFRFSNLWGSLVSTMSLAASLGSDCKETSSDDARSSFLYAVQMGFFSGLVYYENL